MAAICGELATYAQSSLLEQGKTQLKNKQYTTAFSTFKNAATSGNAEAMYYYGLCLENGYGTQRDIYEAMNWYLKAADKGNGEACFRVSQAYTNSCVVYGSHAKAAKYAKLSAQAGCAAGEELYAGLLANGKHGVTKNTSEAMRYYQQSASKGYEDAYCDLAQIYYHGLFGFPVDIAKSQQYLEKLKACKTGRGYNQLAHMYQDGSAGTISYQEAFNLFVKSAEMGCGESADELASLYRYGSSTWSIPMSEENAIYWYKKAYEDGYALSAVRLTSMYENKGLYNEALNWAYKSGDAICFMFCVKDYRNRLSQSEVLTKAKYMADKGVLEAQKLLGEMYDKGEGVTMSFNEASKWYYKAATNKDADVYLYGDLFNSLGIIYAQKDETRADAFKWFKKGAACEYNNAWPTFNLAYCYFNGLGVTTNYYTGFDWMLLAAQKDIIPAMNSVASCYLVGRGTTKNEYKAYEWAKKSADKGDAEGLFYLGMCYTRGIGVSQNSTLGRQYLTQSAGKGYGPAQVALNQQNSQTTSYFNPYTSTNFSVSNAASNIFQSMMDGSLANNLKPDFSNIDFNNLPPVPEGDTYQPNTDFSSSSSSNSYSSSSSSSSKGQLVGYFQAFGLGEAYGNTVTHNQSLAVYRDNSGYYIMTHHLYGDVPARLQSNTKSTYKGYNVSQYNYWVMDVNFNDIVWFIKL